MQTKNELVDAVKAELTAARDIQVKADGRDFTDAEAAAIASHVDNARNFKQRIDRLDHDLAIKSAIAGLDSEMGFGGGGQTARAKALNDRRSTWVKNTLDRIQKASASSGMKALTGGSIDVASPIETGIVPKASTPTRILDLISDRKAQIGGTNTFSFLRQTVRTNNANVVADDALKPTSIYTIAEVEDRCRVIAHLSEAFPKRYLDDHAELGDLLETEMEAGLYLALENQVVAGDGTGENMTGLLNTSGTLAQAYSSNVLQTLRKAVTTMTVVGETPTAWALNPTDAEAIDLLTDNEARHYYDGPQQQLTTAPVWSLPVVQSLAIPAGTAVLANWDYVRLIVRENPQLDVDQSGDLFTHNQVKLRLEGRYGVALRRATAVCEVDLTA